MIYLGENICDISIDRVKMQVMNSRLGKTYTASYRTQQNNLNIKNNEQIF